MNVSKPPAELYQTEKPSTALLLDTIYDTARNLSDAIQEANKRGLNVSIQKSGSTDSQIEVIITV